MKLPHIASSRGSILIVVLWISFGLVALTLYFANSMNHELRAADNRTAAIEAGQAIDGVARYLSNYLGTASYPGVMPSPAELLCEAVTVGEAKYWLIGRDTNDWEINLGTPVFGLVSEASKINLNAPWLTAEMIEYLPGMTPQIAAAIMDWRDENSDITTDGAEDEAYGRLAKPYKTKNAPFESVEELRLVAGMTAEILYGEDANMNGILDANENDSEDSAPYDNRDSRLDPGLMEYFTVYSYAPMTGTNVRTRADVQALLEEVLGQDVAQRVMSQPSLTGNQYTSISNVLDFYLRSGMTEDEFTQVAEYFSPPTPMAVNVSTASQYVLECIPGIGIEYAAQLISYRDANPGKLSSVAWVAAAFGEDQAAEDAARIAGNYITTQSYQYTADIAAVGHHNRGYQRVRYVFDTSEGAPIIIRRQDLTHLGWALGKDTRTQLLAAREVR